MEYFVMAKVSANIYVEELATKSGELIPGFLIDSWYRHSGKNPVSGASRWVETRELARVWRARLRIARVFAFVFATAILGWAAFILPNISERSIIPDIQLAMVCVIIGILIYVGERSIRSSSAESMRENDGVRFLTDLDSLLTAVFNHLKVEISGNKLAHASREDFQAYADRVLVMKAKDVLTVQDAARNVPMEMRNSKEHAIYVFKLFFEQFKKFELADRVYDRYFDVARKELDAEAAQKKQQTI
jgi:membrane protein implicated in regulation of membrane protease activity